MLLSNSSDNKEDVLYEERWQSGRLCRSFFMLLGARNCLNIKFFKDYLIIKPHFPFDLFYPKILGLEHKILYRHIVSCNIKDFLFGLKEVVLIFTKEDGRQEKFVFTTKNPDKVESFCKST